MDNKNNPSLVAAELGKRQSLMMCALKGIGLTTVMALVITAQAQAQSPVQTVEAGAQPAQLVAADSLRFDIAPQPLAAALAAFSEANNLRLLYDAALTRELTVKLSMVTA